MDLHATLINHALRVLCSCVWPLLNQDRRKLLQFVIIYAISPETFPYVVLYAPSLLPSTFEKKHAVLSKYNRYGQRLSSRKSNQFFHATL